jgi:hypothetical protein
MHLSIQGNFIGLRGGAGYNSLVSLSPAISSLDDGAGDGPARFARQARRLRGALRGQPGRLHRELRELRSDSPAARGEKAVDSLPLRSGRAGQFAALAAQNMDGDILRYSVRLGLLRQAARMGIERFEANLIIAAVQHQNGSGASRSQGIAAGRIGGGVGRTALVIAIVQSIIFIGAWWVLGR